MAGDLACFKYVKTGILQGKLNNFRACDGLTNLIIIITNIIMKSINFVFTHFGNRVAYDCQLALIYEEYEGLLTRVSETCDA